MKILIRDPNKYEELELHYYDSFYTQEIYLNEITNELQIYYDGLGRSKKLYKFDHKLNSIMTYLFYRKLEL